MFIRLNNNIVHNSIIISYLVSSSKKTKPYIQVLRETRTTEDTTVFYKFMIQQHIKFLQNQIDAYHTGLKDDLILGK